jgi:hypothetical protein
MKLPKVSQTIFLYSFSLRQTEEVATGGRLAARVRA